MAFYESVDLLYTTVLKKIKRSLVQNKLDKVRENFSRASHSILHFFLLGVGGISQLLVLQHCSKKLDVTTFTSVLLIMGLAVLLSFSDFGAYNIALYTFATNNNHEKGLRNEYSPQLAFLYMIRVVTFFTSISVVLILIDTTRQLGIFMLLNSLSIIGIWSLVVARTLGRVKVSLFLQNLQWPLTYFVLKFLEIIGVKISIFVAYLPSLITLIVVTFYFFSRRKRDLNGIKLRLFLQKNALNTEAWKRIKTDALLFSSLALPLPLIFQGDKYLLALSVTPNELSTYSIYMTLFSGVLSILLVANSISVSEWLKFHRSTSRSTDIRYLGLICGIGFALIAPLIVETFFKNSVEIKHFSKLVGFYIVVLSILFRTNLALSPVSFLRFRIRNLWLHFLSWLTLTSLLIPIINVYSPILSGILVATFHIYLVRRSNLFYGVRG